MIKRIKRNSFTLLEIAVVMVIITIITTATFKGRSLLDNAKLIAIKADIDNISKKTNQFEGQYGGIPGDLANASSLWSGASNGNGNGIIDTPFEALYFWQHLQLAGLIVGNYDGASSYVIFDPNNSSVAGGVYKSGFEGGMYSISNDANYGLSLTLSSTLGSNYTTAILTPTQAYNLDSKYDDGNPNTGIITAYTGNGLGATACINAGMYNFATKTPSCYLKFYLNKKTFTSATAITGCTGSPLGSTRISSQHVCPLGFYGYILESCTATPGATAPSWKEYRNSCEPVSCGDNKQYGDSFTMPCAPGYTGVGNVIYSCTKYGVFTPSDVSACSNINIGACVANATRTLPCPIGYSGTWSQTCSNTTPGSWASNNFSTACTPIQCGLSNIGVASQNDAISSVCTTGFNNTTDPIHAVSACTMPIVNTVTTSVPNGIYQAVKTYCSPDYGSCTPGTVPAPNIRSNLCSKGYSGVINQQCNAGGYWETISNSCKPTNCGGSPIGATRPAHGLSCPYGSIGVPLEVCVYSDTTNYRSANWQASYAACNVPSCPAITTALAADTVANGYATWSSTPAGSSANGTCDSANGYSSSGTPTRACNADGTWGPVTNACTNCPAVTTASSSTGYATWTATPYSTGNTYSGTCQSGYGPNGTNPTMTCNNGSWSAVTNPCIPMCPAINTATPATGNATYSATPQGTLATGSCQSCYQGTAQLQCQSNGTWASSPTSSCTPIPCNNSSAKYAASWSTYGYNITSPCGCTKMSIYSTIYYSSYGNYGSGSYANLINYPVTPLTEINIMYFDSVGVNWNGYASGLGVISSDWNWAPWGDTGHNYNGASAVFNSGSLTGISQSCGSYMNACQGYTIASGCLPIPGGYGQVCSIGGTTIDGEAYAIISFAP